MDSVDINKRDSKPKLKKIKTVNNDIGPNASINQIFRIEVDLPENIKNIPSLRCEVNDSFLKIFEEVLGYFEIDLRKVYEDTDKQLKYSEEMLSLLIDSEKKSSLYF